MKNSHDYKSTSAYNYQHAFLTISTWEYRTTMRPKIAHCCVISMIMLAVFSIVQSGIHAQDNAKPTTTETGFAKELMPFFTNNCLGCHDDQTKKGGLDLSSLSDNLSDKKLMSKWIRIHDRIAKGEMPPRGRLEAKEKATFLKTLANELTSADARHNSTVIRRLNRYEYEHTLHDLLGIRVNLKDMLPEDGKAHGFDNLGEALDVSSVHLERYLSAGEAALNAAIHKDLPPNKTTKRYSFADGRGANFVGSHWLKRADDSIVFFSRSQYPPVTLQTFSAPIDGKYHIRIRGYGYQSGDPVNFSVFSGPKNKGASSVLHGHFSVPQDQPTTIELTCFLDRGDSLRLFPHIPGNFGELKKQGVKAYKGQGLAVQYVEVEGPIIDWPGKGHELLFGDLSIVREVPKKKWMKPTAEIVSKSPSTDAKERLTKVLPLLFRRPVDSESLNRYLSVFESQLESGANFESALRTSYLAALCSPRFLFRIEPNGKLDDYALATRLSYFLWSSMPDETLLSLAAKGQLQDSKVLREQTERLLNDPKAKRFTKHFVGQWLNLREIDFTVPDKQLYPEFDDLLHEAMVQETELFFEEVLHQKRSLLDFIDSDWTILNERLATHYRIDGVKGLDFRKVTLPKNSHRGGVLTHASVLRVSANGTTTSPVVRGAWVLERIIGEPPPPPPPGIPGVEPDIRGATTLRQLLEKHRNVSSCASCHKHIDPPGFALENYDVMGGYRENYRSLGREFPSPPKMETFGKRVAWRVGPKVDASGVTADGKAFDNLEDYKSILLADKQKITRALVEKVATYATGRGMGFSDRPIIQQIAMSVERKDFEFRELIHEIVQSELFRKK